MKTLAALASLACLCAVAQAETLRGTVVAKATHEPVSGVTVTVGNELAATGDDGRFEMTLARGRYTVVVTADWLEPAKLPVMLDRDREVTINEGEFLIVPHGVEHCPVAEAEVELILLEPKTTVNTGSAGGERTAAAEWI